MDEPKKYKVVIVDDDKFLLNMYTMKFTKAGLDGLELLSKIREEKLMKDAVFIVLSNQGQQSDIDKAKQFGIQGYIVKATTIPSEVLKEIIRIAQENGK